MPGISAGTIRRKRRGAKFKPIIFYPDQATSEPITNNLSPRELLSQQNGSRRDEHNYNGVDCGTTAGRQMLIASTSNPKHGNRHSKSTKPSKSSNEDTYSIHSTNGSETSYPIPILIPRKTSPPNDGHNNVTHKLESSSPPRLTLETLSLVPDSMTPLEAWISTFHLHEQVAYWLSRS